MKYVRMPIEAESPEQVGFDRIRFNLCESSMRDRPLSDLHLDAEEFAKLLLAYGDHMGHPGLRERIAAVSGVVSDEVLVTAGAAGALFLFATSLLDRGDHLVVMRPNYATNIETPRAIEADISYLDLSFAEGYRLDLDKLAALIRPNTKYISLTCPHNPTGTMIPETDLRAILRMVESRNCWLLFDETYRELAYDQMLPTAASLSERAVSVSTFSKTYGIPGIRVGWLLCRNQELLQLLLSAKEQIGICGSAVDEELAYQAMLRRVEWMPEIQRRVREAFHTVRRWMEGNPYFEWVEPQGSVVCFPRIRPELAVDIDHFYQVLNERYGTFVGPGHWFEQPRSQMRVGFGWPTPEELAQGLQNLNQAIQDVLAGK